MKKREIMRYFSAGFSAACLPPDALCDLPAADKAAMSDSSTSDLDVGPDPLQPIDHDSVVGLDALFHGLQAVENHAQRNAAVLNLVVLIDNVNEFFPLVSADRPFRHQHRLVRLGHAERTRTNEPGMSIGGSSALYGLENVPRTCNVPVCGSIVLLEKSSVPCKGNLCSTSSASPIFICTSLALCESISPSRIIFRNRKTVGSSMSKYAYIGSMDMIVVKTVESALTRFPGVISVRLMRRSAARQCE